MISLADLVVGLFFLAGTTGSCLVAAWLIVRGRWTGAPLALAWGVVASATVIAAHLVPGALGVLTRWSTLLTALLILAGTTRFRTNVPKVPGTFGTSGLVGVVVLAVGACVFAVLRETAGTVVTGLDATTFHVPMVGRWIQTESLWGLHQWLPDYSNATYPGNGNLLQMAVILPFRHTFMATLVAVPYMAMAGVAAYALGRELGAGQAAAALAAAALVAVPEVADVSLATAVTDAPALAFIGAAIVFGVRGELPIAGLALGLAAGTKWYGLSYAAVLVVVYLLTRRQWRGLPTAIGIGAAAGGFWLIRNWVETGNPLFPVATALFDAPPDLIREQAGFTILHYLGDWDVWRTYLRPAFEDGFGWTGAALAAAAIAAAALARRGAVVAVTVAFLGLVLAYFATPYSAFGGEGQPVLASASTRYALPALLAAAGAAAWLIGRGGLLARLLVAAAVLDGLRRGFPGLSVWDLLAGAGMAGFTFTLLRAPRFVSVPVAALAFLVGAEILRQRANDASYTSYSPLYADLRADYGLAGAWPLSDVAPILPSFGERLRNDVDYLGFFEDGYLRAHRDQAGFVADLADRDRLIVGCDAECPATEERWARAAGWQVVARDDGLVALGRP